MTLTDLKQLHEARASGPIAYYKLLEQLGSPTPDDLVALALSGLKHSDKNARVCMLRTLAHYPSLNAATGILQGLKDKERRVRNVAIQISRAFYKFPEITEQLLNIIENDDEKPKLRQKALGSLAGIGGGKISTSAISALEKLMRRQQFRQIILLGITQVEINEDVERFLKDIVKSGNEEETAIARKALEGYKVINLGYVNQEARAKLIQNNDLAFGSVWYWVKRPELRT